MATESRRMYSWWWDSHISPKNSKWLQENLTDIDTNVKTMIKLIEEDADSFARRAEMYYKKRPELMKLVEEFYRAYRALAERYDHATGALRQAHRTMAEAFPNQIPLVLPDESPSGSSVTELEPHTPEMPTPIRVLFEPEDLQKDALGISSHCLAIKRNGAFSEEHDVMGKKGLKQLNEMFATGGVAQGKLAEGKVRKGLNFQEEEGKNIEHRTRHGSKEKNQGSWEKEVVDKEIKNLQEEVLRLAKEIQNLESRITLESERADKAETEIGILKESLCKLHFEKETALLQYQVSLERISDLETELSLTQDDFKKLNSEMMKQVTKLSDAEGRCLHFEKVNQSIKSDFESLEQKAKFNQYELDQKQEELDKVKLSLQLIEELYFQSQEEVTRLSLNIQCGVEKLKDMELSSMSLLQEVHQLKEQNGNFHEQTVYCAQEMENLQNEIILLKERKGNLEEEVEFHVEEKRVLQQEFCLLKEERDDLEHKHKDLKEQTHEMSLNIELLKALIKELQDGNAELNEICKRHEQEKVFRLRNLENLEMVSQKNVVLERSLSDANIGLEGLRQKINLLEKSCESLQGQLSVHVSEKAVMVSQLETTSQDMEKLAETNTFMENSLSNMSVELGALKIKMKDLEDSYQSLDDERTNLCSEKNTLMHQVETSAWNMDKLLEENASLEKSLSDRNAELESQRANLKSLEELSKSLYYEKSSILAEKSALVSQLEAAAENMEKLSENNAFWEKSLSETSITLEKLTMRLKGLEESCQSLCNEKSKLIAERNALVSQLEAATWNMEKLSENNAFLEKSLSEVNITLENLTMRLKGLEDSFQSLNNEKSKLIAEKNALVSQLEAATWNMEKLSENNAFLEKSLSEANLTLENLTQSLKGQEESCQSLYNEKSKLIAEKNALVSQVETTVQYSKKLSEENVLLEKSLFVANINLDTLGVKLKGLEESCQSLYVENSNLLVEKNTLISQVESISKSLENLENKYKELEEKHLNLEEEEVLILNQLTELQECLKLDKQENEIHMQLYESQLATLENQIRFLREEGQMKEEEIEMEQQRDIYSQTESFIMQRCMLDMIETNLNLSVEYQRHLEASRCMEKIILDIKKENQVQKMKFSSLVKHNNKLTGGISLFLKALNIRVNFGPLDGINDEVLLQIILGEIRNLMNAVSDSWDESQQLVLEKLVITTVLQQLGLDMVYLSTERNLLELESQVRAKELSMLQTKKDELLELNGHLKQDLQLGVQREREMKVEMDVLHGQISDLQEAHCASHNEIRKLVAESSSLSKKLDDLKEERDAKEAENNAILEEAMTLDFLSSVFRSLGNERALELNLVSNGMDYLKGLNNDLNQWIRNLNQKVEVLEVENTHLKESTASLEECKCRLVTLENDLTRMHDQCERLNLQIQISENLSMQKDLELSEANQKMQEAHQRSQGEIHKLIEEKQALSEEFYDLLEQKDEVDDENSAIIEEAITLECLFMFFRNLSSERALDLKSYGSDVDRLLKLNNDLYKEIRVLNEQVQVFAVENMHLKKFVLSLEEALHTSQSEISKLTAENKSFSKELYKLKNRGDEVEEENYVLIVEALTVESLYLYFRSLSDERGSGIHLLSNDLERLSQTKNGLDEDIRVMNERMKALEVEKIHLKESVVSLENELETSRNFSEQLNLQTENIKNILTNKDRELSEANWMVQSTRERNTKICQELEVLKVDIDEAKVFRKDLEMNILILSGGNAYKDKEIMHLHEAKELLEGEYHRLHKEVEVLRSREEHLTSQLKKGTYEVDQCEEEIVALLSDIQTCTINAALFEENVLEWIVDSDSALICAIVKEEMLYEEINVKNAYINNLEGENRRLRDSLNSILPLVMSLWNSMTCLEDQTLSLAKFQISKNADEQDDFLASIAYDGRHEEPKEDDSTSTKQPEVIQLKELLLKVEKLQKVVLHIRDLLEKERLHLNAYLDGALCQKEGTADTKLHKDDSEICKKNHGQMMKDIQLDQVSSSLLYGGGACLYRPSKIEISETDDEMLELWETAERDCNKMRSSVANEHNIEYHQIEAVEEEKSEYPSSELMAEKELGIDKLELPITTIESYVEWKTKVLQRLTSDAQRLSVLQTGLYDLKEKMESSERGKTPLCIEYSSIKTQLKEAEGAILQLIDINKKLTRKAEDNSRFSSSLNGEKEELGKTRRRHLSERARRGSEKIGDLELELHKIQYIFLKLEEDNQNRIKAMERRSSILLRDYIYEKKGNLRKKKGAFCGCMRPKTKE